MNRYIIDISGTCNLRCPSCAVGNYKDSDFLAGKKLKGFMELSLFKDILKKIKAENTVVPELELYNWGEPLLHPQVIDFLKLLVGEGFSNYYLSTNFNVEVDLKELVRANPKRLRVSVSGFYQETYEKGHRGGKIAIVKSNLYRLRYYMDKLKLNFPVEVFYHLYRDNLEDFIMMDSMCKELHFEVMPGWALFVTLEKVLGYLEGKISPEDKNLIERLVIPIEEMVEVAKNVHQVDCPLRSSQMAINYDGSVTLCCAVYDPQYDIASSFLDVSHEELQKRKYAHPFCKRCMKKSLPQILTYSIAADLDRIGNEKIGKGGFPFVISMCQSPHLSKRDETEKLPETSMNRKIELMYLDLIKKTLSFMLWEEPGIPVEKLEYELPATVQDFVRNYSAFLKENSLQLAQRRDWLLQGDSEVKIEGKFWPGYAHTMIGLKRLNNLESCINNVLQNHIEGDFIEAGVWRGGACIFMRAVLASHEITNRRVFLADSFAGLPPPDESKYPPDTGDTLHKSRYLAVSLEEVKANFEKYGLLDDQVVFLKGWFKDTLPKAPIEKLAILRANGDMYESTMDILTNLYPKLSVGGFCIIDDYNCIPACKQAVDDFRSKWNIKAPIQQIDWTGVFWKKSEAEKQAKELTRTTNSQQPETTNFTPSITANHASSNLRTKVKLYDLGNFREEYKGILSPVYDDGVVKKYITEQFLDNASVYANRYQSYAYWEWLLRTAQQHLSLNNLEPLRILDIGSGAGNTIFPLFKLYPNASIVASDLSVPLLKIFKDLYEKDYGARTCTIIQLNAEEIVFEDNQFDLVVGGAILHHLLSPERAIKECLRVLKPQGYAVFFEPFESGNSAVASVLLKLLELNELFHQQDEPLTPEIARFFKAWCHDIDVRKKMSKDNPLLPQLDDKWLFTKQYFQKVSESVGGEVVMYSVSDMTEPFSNTIRHLLKVGLQLEEDCLPKWAINYLLGEEEKFLRVFSQEAMMREGCIIFHKTKPRATLAFQPKCHSQSEENMTSLVNTIFELPKILKLPYSWVEHIPFAFFLIHTLKPRVLVELGVYVGNSYNAFCQAVSLLKTATQCYGIDTWRGDEHTNLYDESVYNELFAYQQREYSEFSFLLRNSFDDMLESFEDNAIDLLHIDGFHTYEAVKHDFENWLPKVSNQGVVIFHDTEVREHDFGVWRLWEELAQIYPSFNFKHGYGLGVIAVGAQVPQEFLNFLQAANQEPFYRELFARLGHYITVLEQNKTLEKSVPSQHLFAQLFIDTGAGFEERRSLIKTVTGEESQLAFDLSGYDSIKQLRFDPLNTLVIVRIPRIVLIDQHQVSHELESYEDNALIYQADKTLVFDTEDSLIYLNLQNYASPQRIVFSVEYVAIGTQALSQILKLEHDQRQTLEQQNQKFSQDLENIKGKKRTLKNLLHQHQLPSRYLVQLFIDTGAGFSEEQSIIQEVTEFTENEQQFEFDLSSYENLKQLRFDPLNTLTALRIEQIVIVDGRGLTHRLNYQPVNAYAQLGEILVFDTEDSQILITWPNLEEPKKVVIRLQYVAMGINTYRFILQREQEIIKQQGEQIRYLTQLVQ